MSIFIISPDLKCYDGLYYGSGRNIVPLRISPRCNFVERAIPDFKPNAWPVYVDGGSINPPDPSDIITDFKVTTGKTLYELGEVLDGSVTISYSIDNPDSIEGDTLDILLNGEKIGEVPKTGSTATFNLPQISYDEYTEIELTIQGIVGGKTVSKNIPIQWVASYFWGQAESLSNPATLQNGSIKQGQTPEIIITFAESPQQYKWLFLPDYMPKISEIIDINTNFRVPMTEGEESSYVNDNGVTVNGTLYRSYNKLGGELDVKVLFAK